MSGLTRVNRNTAGERRDSPVLYPPPQGGPGAGFRPAGPGGPYGGGPYGGGLGGPGSGFSTPSPGTRPGSQASQYSESPFGGGMSSGPPRPGQAYELESHNDDLLKGLLGKVDVLKNLSIGIGDEVRAGNLELQGMTDTFGSTGAYLRGTYRRMMKMAGRQGSTWCAFMAFMLLVLCIFVVVWWLRR